MATGFTSFSPSNNHLGANLAFTKFLFVISRDDDAIGTRLRSTGGLIARGFFNDFDADGARDVQPHETIHFLIADRERPEDGGLGAARYAVQVSGKYRPRLQEVEAELRRERPAPSREFGDQLRERLLTAELAAHRPPSLWLLVAAYAACGILLLVIAAIGAGGAIFGS